MPRYPEIYVIRHGQTEWNLVGRHQGRKDSPLTELGRAQARDMGALMARELAGRAGVSAFTSPQGRARATAELVCAPAGLSPVADDRLCEIDFGAWEGLTHDEVLTRWPETEKLVAREGFGWHFHSPGGETLADLKARARDWLAELQGPAVAVTHGVLSRVLRAQWLGLDDREMLDLPGGQGVVFHLSAASGHRVLEPLAASEKNLHRTGRKALDAGESRE